MITSTSKLASVAVALTALSACNSLENPGHPALEVGIAADGTTALFFYDGVGIGDPVLNVARFMPYPEPTVRMGLHKLSHDGTRALVSWNDEGNQANPDGGINPPRDKPRIDVFAVSDGQLLQAIEMGHNGLALSDDGTRLVVNGPSPRGGPTPDAALTAFDVADGTQRWTVPGVFSAVATIPGANAVAATWVDYSTRAYRLQIFDLDTGTARLDVPLPYDPGSLAASPDGSVVALGTQELTAVPEASIAHYLVMNVADGALVRDLVLQSRTPMPHVAVSAGGRAIAGQVSLDGTVPPMQLDPSGFYAHEVVIWQDGMLTLRKPAEAVGQYDQMLAFSPDGSVLVSAEYDSVAVYAVATGEEVLRQRFKQNVF